MLFLFYLTFIFGISNGKIAYIEGIYEILVAVVNKMETFKEKKNVLFISKAQNKQHFYC